MANKHRTFILGAICLLCSLAHGETLRVVSWSGNYVKSQILGFIRPFEEATGIDVEVLQYTGGIEEIRSQVRSYNVKWDVVDFELFDAIRACEEGLLEPFDPSTLPPAPDGTPAREDFIPGSLMDCGVGNVVGSTIVAYNREQFKEPPSRLEDFFDIRRYPGPRGMRRTPKVNLEWALIADGVAPGDVYAVLDTPEGIDRAFEALDTIKPYIVWWRTGEEAMRMLETGEVLMTSVYNGRVHGGVERGLPLEIIWDHQVWFIDVWGIVKHTENLEIARQFVRFATSSESLARQVRYIPYGPARKSSMESVTPEIRRLLPTEEENFETALEGDAEWWAENLDRLTRRFEQWADRPIMVPQRLRR